MTLYFDPSLPLDRQQGFAAGAASAFELLGDELVVHGELTLSPNTRSALLAFGFAARLHSLCGAGTAGAGGETLLFPSVLESAIELLYAAEAETWNGTLGEAPLELAAFAPPLGDGRERRIRFDRREYQRSLIRLGDLLNAARRAGHGVRIAL